MTINSVDLPAYLVAFGGGVASFLSPCVLPLVPAYLSIVSGVNLTDTTEPRAARDLRRVVGTTGLFVGGFSRESTWPAAGDAPAGSSRSGPSPSSPWSGWSPP